MTDTSFDPELLDELLRQEEQRAYDLRMARRRYRARYIKRLKIRLAQLLGDRCALCRRVTTMEPDHVEGRDWHPHWVNPERRILKYIREIEAGVNIRPLCRSCNAGYNPKRDRHGKRR